MKTKKTNFQLTDIKEDAFKVPESYFDDLEKQILSNTVYTEQNPLSHSIQLWSQISYSVVSIAVLLVAFFLLTPNTYTKLDSMDFIAEELLYTSYDDAWIAQEMMFDDDSDGNDISDHISFLLAEGVTNTEILEVYLNNN